MHHAFTRSAALLICGLASSALSGAASAETPLQLTLGPDYVQRDAFSLAEIAAPVGQRLTFSLLGEATGWAASQTFSLVDGGNTDGIFAGADTAGAQASYVVRSGITGIVFASNSGNPQQFAPGGSDGDYRVFSKPANGSTAYAFAYEDYNHGSASDYNDMVVGLTVTAAVPEAGTLALMLAGLGFITLRLRGQR